ncbi:hypothetical protein L3Q82_005196 [Scortum barcoo]|uniref:Uncharacterized protein n=1 Tax=Scortum barcoo TaxID=214431 RepID=A0ACB8VAC7_9TELE|nr:hypothetical protein L3Q82_005196 [Scortum barcoo]
MAARLGVQQTLDLIFQDEEVDSDLDEDVSEQEDNVEENSDYSPSDEDDSDGEEQAARQGGHLCRKTVLSVGPSTSSCRQLRMTPEQTRLAISHASDILSMFQLFLPPAIEKIIVIAMTNMEGIHRYGEEWKTMDVTDPHAYMGLLILGGDVYRSRGETVSSLWEGTLRREDQYR